MEQKDYMLREIEKIGKMLMYLMKKMTPDGLIKTHQAEVKQVYDEFAEQTGFSIDELLEIPSYDFSFFLSAEKGFSVANIEHLADLLHRIALNEYSDKSKLLYAKALELYEYATTLDKTFSFDRQQKKDSIRARINE